jgi:hypothetical protein
VAKATDAEAEAETVVVAVKDKVGKQVKMKNKVMFNKF